MNIDLLNIFIIFMLFLIMLEFSNYKNNFIHLVFLSFVLLSLFFKSGLWNSDLFELSSWKLLFLTLVFMSFFMMVELMQENTFDVYCLLMLVLLGSVILILSDNLLILYLGLELQTFSMFILIAKNSNSVKSSEAGLKYFMLGAISSGFFLLSMVILFLYGLDLNLKHLLLLNNDLMVFSSLMLISMSFCFKLSLFPFHFWIPDIYEGSSWDMVCLIATLPKISMVCVLLQILFSSNMIIAFCLLSIIIGTLGALNQSKIKSLLGYSGMSHMGFMMLGLSMINNQGLTMSGLYLMMYMLSMISLFIMIMNGNFKNDFIIELGGMKFMNNIMGMTLVLMMLSMAGIPPLSGFMSKWYLIWSMMENYFSLSSFMIILFSAMGVGYYLSIVKMVYFQKSSSYFLWSNILEVKTTKNETLYLFLGFLFFTTLFLMVNFSFMVNLLNNYLTNMY